MSICLIDTSILCNVLCVPGRDQDHDAAIAELARLIDEDWSLLLPLAAVYETGNHIANAANGERRRRSAETFVAEVKKAFDGNAPWSPTPIDTGEEFICWLQGFPDSAMRGIGLADLSIVEIFHKQCRLHPLRRVRIWSLDQHLAGFDRVP